ncbi:MAG: YkgJ family cysteine cluster protein [Phycisphaerae bacterium]
MGAGVVDWPIWRENPVVSTSLPILMPAVPEQQWSCHSCSYCCREAVVHLTEEDRRRIVQQGWSSRLDVMPMVQAGGGWVLNKRTDGACVFLDEANLCQIHKRFGLEQKPLACRLFPFSVREVDGAMQATVRFDCPSMARSEGQPLANHASSVSKMSDEVRAVMPAMTGTGDVFLQPGRLASIMELHTINGTLASWMRRDLPLSERVIGMARFATLLGRTRLGDMDETNCIGLLELLGSDLESESQRGADLPLPKQSSLFRQVVFAHTEHVGLPDLQAHWLTRMGKRFGQAGRARRYLKGDGVMPAIPGLCGTTTFARIAEVTVSSSDRPFMESLMQRYVLARLTGDSVFGDGYYGWPVAHGLSALCLSVAAIGFLGRAICAAEGRDLVTAEDCVRATGAIDRAASRLPALGTMAERTRIAYLWEDDGLARLVFDQLAGESGVSGDSRISGNND